MPVREDLIGEDGRLDANGLAVRHAHRGSLDPEKGIGQTPDDDSVVLAALLHRFEQLRLERRGVEALAGSDDQIAGERTTAVHTAGAAKHATHGRTRDQQRLEYHGHDEQQRDLAYGFELLTRQSC